MEIDMGKHIKVVDISFVELKYVMNCHEFFEII